jgi:2-polyprenyl-3-methyl-5-hydroxy-6-metoxy-1,4-benzoquinol methylase
MVNKKGVQKNEFDGALVFGLKNFNKKTGRNNYVNKILESQTAYFIDPQTGFLYERMAEERNCPVCRANKFNVLFVKDGFKHVKCMCGFIFVNPTAKDEYRDIFLKDHLWTKVLLSPEQELIDTNKFKYGLELIEGHIDKKGFLADIGAGSGLFLKIARNAGWKVSGVEFSLKGVKSIKKLGIEVFDRPMSSGIYAPDSIDIVTIWEVLEHINNPNEFIAQIRNILKPNGFLFVCVPNINSFVTRILHEKAHTFGGNSHVNFFSIETLSKFLKKNGFEMLKADTVISEISTIKNYISYEDPYSGCAEPMLNFLTPEFLYNYNLGSRIFMLAKKK